jgi:predicted phage-related endonuclease
MPIESWQITGRDEWLERRRQDITGSVAAALLGVHERITPLQLYRGKER